MTAWAFLVVSSDSQAESLSDQERWAQHTAASNGWQILRTFRGVSSGKEGTRKLLTDLLGELRGTPKTQRPQRILMIRLDRTGRGIGIDSLAAIAEIRQLGVLIHTREDGDLKIERAADTLVPFMRVLTGALENEARSDKWKAVIARRKAQGLHVGTLPFGVVLVDGKAVPYEPEAALVRELFTLAAKGWGYRRIASFAAQRSTSKRLSDGSSRPQKWQASTVAHMLKSTTVRGLVVPETLWDEVQAVRKGAFRARIPKRWNWPLNGAVRCTCGKLLTGHCSGPRLYRRRYYVCRHHDVNVPMPRHRADDLEASFLALLGRIVANPDLMLPNTETGRGDELQRRESALRKDLEEQERRRQKVWTLAEGGTLSGEQLRERLDEIDADRTALKNQLQDVRVEIERVEATEPVVRSVLGVLGDLAALWPTADVEAQQEAARGIAATPTIAGLWAHPQQPGKLYAGFDVAKLQLADVNRRIGTIEQVFPGKLLGLAQEMKKAPARR